MKEKILFLALLAMTVLTFTACDDDDDDNNTPTYLTGAVGYTAGAGNWNANDGTVGAILLNGSTYGYSDIYTAQNGYGIGDAQDVLPLGGDIYVACTTSSKIEVLNQDGLVEKSFSMPNKSPRYLATDGVNVYVSAYSGYVYKVSKALGITDSVLVGDHPEAMSVANGKLYVNLSNYNNDGTGRYIAVVDLATFRKTKNVECALNPYNQSVTDGRNVYFVSNFDYSRPYLVQRLNATTDQVDSLFEAALIAYSPKTSSIIALQTAYDSNWNLTVSEFFAYNTATGQRTDLDHSAFTSPQQVNVDPQTGNIYVIDNPSYNTPSVLYVYDQTGKLLQGGITLGYSVQNIRFPYESYK